MTEAWVLALVPLVGCVIYDDTTHVIIHDPGAVTASIRRAERGYGDAWIARDAAGAIDVWCPACAEFKRRTLLESTDLAVTGVPTDLLRFDGDHVGIKVDYDDRVYCGRRRWCARHALTVELETSRANVESIRFDHLVSPRNGGSPLTLAFGIGYAVVGLVVAGVGVHGHSSGLIGFGLGATGVGLGLGALDLSTALATDTITAIPPR